MLGGEALLEPLRCGTVWSLLSLAVTLETPTGRATSDIVFVVDQNGGHFVFLDSALPSLHYPDGTEARWLGLREVEVSNTCAFRGVSYVLLYDGSTRCALKSDSLRIAQDILLMPRSMPMIKSSSLDVIISGVVFFVNKFLWREDRDECKFVFADQAVKIKVTGVF